MTSDALVPTPDAARYVTRLATHFAHKTDVERDGDRAQVDFADGTCTLAAEPDGLALRVEADDPATVARLEDVVARHLHAFAAGREALTVVWASTVGD